MNNEYHHGIGRWRPAKREAGLMTLFIEDDLADAPMVTNWMIVPGHRGEPKASAPAASRSR